MPLISHRFTLPIFPIHSPFPKVSETAAYGNNSEKDVMSSELGQDLDLELRQITLLLIQKDESTYNDLFLQERQVFRKLDSTEKEKKQCLYLKAGIASY